MFRKLIQENTRLQNLKTDIETFFFKMAESKKQKALILRKKTYISMTVFFLIISLQVWRKSH